MPTLDELIRGKLGKPNGTNGNGKGRTPLDEMIRSKLGPPPPTISEQAAQVTEEYRSRFPEVQAEATGERQMRERLPVPQEPTWIPPAVKVSDFIAQEPAAPVAPAAPQPVEPRSGQRLFGREVPQRPHLTMEQLRTGAGITQTAPPPQLPNIPTGEPSGDIFPQLAAPPPVTEPQLFEPPAVDIKDFLDQSGPEQTQHLLTGLRKGGALFPHLAANMVQLGDTLSTFIIEKGFGGEIPEDNLTDRVQAALRKAADDLANNPANLSPDTFEAKILQAVGEAVPSFAAAIGATTVAGGPVTGLAALGALTEADKGVLASAVGAAHGAIMGAVLRFTGGLPAGERIPLTAGAFGGSAYLATGDPVDALIQALVGAGLAIPGRGGPGLRERLERFVETGEQNINFRQNRDAILRQMMQDFDAGTSEVGIISRLRSTFGISEENARQAYRHGRDIRMEAMKEDFQVRESGGRPEAAPEPSAPAGPPPPVRERQLRLLPEPAARAAETVPAAPTPPVEPPVVQPTEVLPPVVVSPAERVPTPTGQPPAPARPLPTGIRGEVGVPVAEPAKTLDEFITEKMGGQPPTVEAQPAEAVQAPAEPEVSAYLGPYDTRRKALAERLKRKLTESHEVVDTPRGHYVVKMGEQPPTVEAQPPELAPAAKEPWEMTREEFGARRKTEAETRPEMGDIVRYQGKEYEIGFIRDRDNRMRLQSPETKAGQIYATPDQIEIVSKGEHDYSLPHRLHVAKALAQGKPVPPEVLADYPDLQAKQQARPAAPPAAAEQPQAPALSEEGAARKAGRTALESALKRVEAAIPERAQRPQIYAIARGIYQNEPGASGKRLQGLADKVNEAMDKVPRPPEQPEAGTAPAPEKQEPPLTPDEQELKQLEERRSKTRVQEDRIKRLKKRIAVDPSKWNTGNGVGWRVYGNQINRGFRIVSVNPEAKTAIIRQVADTGITTTGGDYDRIPDTEVEIIDLVRDRKYDAAEAPAAAPPDTPYRGYAIRQVGDQWQVVDPQGKAIRRGGSKDRVEQIIDRIVEGTEAELQPYLDDSRIREALAATGLTPEQKQAQLRPHVRRVMRQETGKTPAARRVQEVAEKLTRPPTEAAGAPEAPTEAPPQPPAREAIDLAVGDYIRYRNAGGVEVQGDVTRIWDDGKIDVEADGAKTSIGIQPEQIIEVLRKEGKRRKQVPAQPEPRPAPETMEDLARQVEEQGKRTEGRLDRERVEAEQRTRMRPRQPQAPPTGLFEQEQELPLGEKPKPSGKQSLKKTPDIELELKDFIRKHGGMSLEGAGEATEFRDIIGRKEGGPQTAGLLNKNGMRVQSMAELAAERGFILEANVDELRAVLEMSVGREIPIYSKFSSVFNEDPPINPKFGQFYGDIRPPSAGFYFADLDTFMSRGNQSNSIKAMFRAAARLMHPDLGNQNDAADVARRTRFMQAAVDAFQRHDATRLQALMDRFKQGWTDPDAAKAPPPPPPPGAGPATPPTPRKPPPPPYTSNQPPRSPMEMPEVVELAKSLFEGSGLTIRIQEQLAREEKGVRGYFQPGRGIRLAANIFKDPQEAIQVVAHEIGHAIDWIEGFPDRTMKRGNILGSLASLHRFMMREFRGVLNKDIRKELIALTNAWKPFDPAANPAYTRYRYNARELYADYISALFNNPNWAQQTAPRTFDAFFMFLWRKPRVKALYDGIQSRIAQGGVSERRTERVREMFERGEEMRRKKAEEQAATSRYHEFSDFLLRTFIDRDHPILKPVRQAEKTGTLADADNPRYWIESMRYGQAGVRAWLSEQVQVKDRLDAAGITEKQFGALLFHDRVIHERGQYANPEGFEPKSSKQQLNALEADVGPEKWRAMQEIATEFRQAWSVVREMMRDAEILTPAGHDAIEQNPYYAAFNVLHHWENSTKDIPEFGMSSGVFHQVGTFSEIENPYVATVLKGVSTIRMIQRKQAAHSLVEFLRARLPEQIEPAPRGQGGRLVPPPDRSEWGMLAYPHEGKVVGWWVPKGMARSFESNWEPYQQAGKYLGALASPFRSLFVRYNPGFMVFNMLRDPISTAMNLPQTQTPRRLPGGPGKALRRAEELGKGIAMPLRMVPYFLRALPPSWRRGLRKPDKIIEELERGNMLVSFMDDVPLNDSDTELERLLKTYSLRPPTWRKYVVRPFSDLFTYLETLTTMSEMMSKVAAHQYLKNVSGLSPEWKAHAVRDLAGTPPLLRKGEAAPIYNNMLLFSNVWKEGTRRDYEAFRRDPVDYLLRRMVWSVMPKLIMLGMATGLLGDENKAIIDGASEYDKTNYTIIPIGLKGHKSFYIRLPNDELGRLIGGIVWKVLNIARKEPGGDIGPLFDYMAGQAPTVNPLYVAVADAISVALGHNPIDRFRGRPVVNEREFEAGGWRRWTGMLRHLWNSLGGTVIAPDLPRYLAPGLSLQKGRLREAERADARDWLEKTLNLPVGLLAPLQRFIKITDAGHADRLRAIAREAKTERTEENLLTNEAIVDWMHQNRENLPLVLPTPLVTGLYRKMLREGYHVGTPGQFQTRVKDLQWLRVDNPWFQAWVRATSDPERIRILQDFKAHQRPEELKQAQ